MQNLTIVVQRERQTGDLIIASLSCNGKLVGKTYENAALKIPAGSYPGTLRYVSGHNFVQGPFGIIARHGDFLLEASDVPGRADILFHGGNKARHSKGCILLGAVGKDPRTHDPVLSAEHPLRKLRSMFYGGEFPVECPDKNVTIRVVDVNACYP